MRSYASPRIRATWAMRTAAEYRSACVSSEMLHWCLVLGVAPALVDDVHRLVQDERDHADLSRDVHEAAGGRAEEASIGRHELSFRICPEEPLERRALAAAFQELAVHETLALELFRAMRRGLLVGVVSRAVERIVRDEARHRRTGWRLVDALLDRTGEREWLASLAPAAIAGIVSGYPSTAGPATTAEEGAWGLLDPEVVRASVQRALRGPLAVNLARRGL